MILYRMKVLFTIWAKVGTNRDNAHNQDTTQGSNQGSNPAAIVRFAPDKKNR